MTPRRERDAGGRPQRAHGWGAGAWHEGARPPWWPDDEPFPPHDWRRRRHRVMRGFAVFAIVAFVTFALAVAFVVALLVQAITAISGAPPPGVAIAVAALLVLAAIARGAGGARRVAALSGDLVDAAEQVERGDYSVRVVPRGPRTVRRLAAAFNAMSARLERSEEERRRLLADVTHELRTPLTVVQGDVEALIDGVHPADDAHLRAILDETKVLSRLIDDLRTVSVAEAGALPLHREPTDVAGLVHEVAASFAAPAESAGVRVSVEADAAGTATIDPLRVREILSNVIANALRYTPRDGVVEIRASGDALGVSVAVRDSGPGIPAEVLPHVFERFTRSPDSPGAGLGLAIARSLVTAHGGTIDASSEPGRGATIRFRLPREEAAPSEA